MDPSYRIKGCACCDAGGLPTRRAFLAGAAATAGAALGGPAFAQAPDQAARRLIDIHHHLAPPAYIPELVKRQTNQRPLVEWTVEKTLESMDQAGIETSILSISEPGVWFGDEAEARRIARETNDWGAALVQRRPEKFGLFASLPIPDIDASLKEIAYAFDTLKADGICMMTSYGGKYLGDPSMQPVMEELNRRRAVVFTHPVKADCCRNLIPGVGENTIELATDTARAVTSLLFSGTLTRFPQIRFIFSHAGGTVPSLTGRLLAQANSPEGKKALPEGPIVELRKLYYDTANAANPWAMAPLLKLVAPTQIVYGSDYPFRSPKDTAAGMRDLGFTDAELRGIERDNARRLLPRLV
ncbi:MAG: TIM-barrel fold metal-dependent hydrolase [Hyphomicrobiales bacterium]|nr:TIM-barrel fold metal-dependent hydrolase [Hyphomicrobiales bacterium]